MINRRKFLATAGMAAMSVPAWSLSQVKKPPLASSDRKICVFTKHLQWLDYAKMADAIDQMGFDGVDLTVRAGGHVEPVKVEDQLPRAVEDLKRHGKKVYMMTTRITDPNDPLTERILKTASQLDIRFYRMGYLGYEKEKGILGSLDNYRPQMKELADLNRQYQVHGAYQNHAGTRVGGPVWDLAYLLNGLHPQYIGCQYDVRHATVEGGNSWILGMELLAPMIRSTVIKDFLWVKDDEKWKARSVPLQEGMVDFDKYWEVVKHLQIGGPLSLHFEYPLLSKIEQQHYNEAEKIHKTVAIMKEDVVKLKEMMKSANL
ncbi:MAG: sugar phosphate isomerase/epimerase family protein [Candidatus Cyclobacteriaceae bacterium M3_2C_046]